MIDRLDWQRKRETPWPWERCDNPNSFTPDDFYFCDNYGLKQRKFDQRCYQNKYLDLYTKSAAIKASASVVSLVTYSDDKEIFHGSGTIIEENGTILTSVKLVTSLTSENVVAENLKVNVYLWDGKSYEAELLAHDFYYGIAVVKIKQDAPLTVPPACLRLVDDCISVDPSELHNDYDKKIRLCPHSNTCNLVPGNKVIALGRYFIKPYQLMAAPGEFCINNNEDECEEHFRTTSLITTTGIGGPFINHRGEVIGIAMHNVGFTFTFFVPVNIALKWWDHYKRRLPRRPLLGMKVANLYTAELRILEKLILKFPDNFVGVIVEQVKRGSSAFTAGLRPNDLIVKCCGKPVRSFLEFFDMIWDKAGGSVELAVLRANVDAQLDLSMEVDEATWGLKRKRSSNF